MHYKKEAREGDITTNNRSIEASLPWETVTTLKKRKKKGSRKQQYAQNSISGRQQGAKGWLRNSLLDQLCLRQLPPCYVETDSKAKRLEKCPKSENVAMLFKKGASNEVPGQKENAV